MSDTPTPKPGLPPDPFTSALALLPSTLPDPFALAASASENSDLKGLLGEARLTKLLRNATLDSGAGTAATRLRRVLAGVGSPVPGDDVLVPLIGAKARIGQKILRGPDGIAPPPGTAASGPMRAMKGGHSAALLSEPATHLVQPDNPLNLPTERSGAVLQYANGTRGVKFKRMLRGDAGNFCGAVAVNAPDSITAQAQGIADRAIAAIRAVAKQDTFPATIAQGSKIFGPKDKPYDLEKVRWTKVRNGAEQAEGQYKRLGEMAGRAQVLAVTAVNNPSNARDLGAFDDIVKDILAAATMLSDLGNQAAKDKTDNKRLTEQKQQYDAFGPVFSVPKISTLAPVSMSDDEILLMGDGVAAQPSRLLRQRPNNTPAPETLVETKPMQVVEIDGKNVLWVTMKEGVTFTASPKGVGKNGSVVSSYPTSLQALPGPPSEPNKGGADLPKQDDDGFSLISEVP